MNRSTTPTRTIRCPGCSGPSVYAPDNPHRPFCSARCKNNDFGAWASETYAVPAAPTDPSDSSPPEITSGRDSTQH